MEMKSYISGLKQGMHACSIFRDREEQLSVIIPYFIEGLKRNEKCVYLGEEASKNELLRAFRKLGINIDQCAAWGQFIFLKKEDSYYSGGYFSPENMISLIRNAESEALKDGYDGLRGTGEVFSCIGPPDLDKFMDYEARLNHFIPNSRSLALCQYFEPDIEEAILMDAIHTHPSVILNQSLCRNPFYMEPEIFLSRKRADLQQGLYKRVKDELVGQ